jgi:hypothetical protein
MEFLSPNPSYPPKLPKNYIEKASHNIIFETNFFMDFLSPDSKAPRLATKNSHDGLTL